MCRQWLGGIAMMLALTISEAEGEDLVAEAMNQTPPAIDISTGHEIPSEGYCDQPYVVKLPDGTWLCTMTTGRGDEGQSGQHVVSCRSSNRGKTWEPHIDIEPADGPEASWAMPYLTAYGRVYVICGFSWNVNTHSHPK